MYCSIRLLPRLASRRISKTYLSTVPAEKATDSNLFDKNINDLKTVTTVFSKNRTKLPQREPFVKNLFLGKVDTEILAYPELKKEDVDELEKNSDILKRIVDEQGKPKNIKEALLRRKMQKCLGLQCSIDIGGRELNQSEQCRFNEILLNDPYKYSLLYNELCIYILSQLGTDDQKRKYLPKLLNGEMLATISLADNSIGFDNNNLRASVTENFDSYILNGKKKCIFNGRNADFFVIFAQNGDIIRNSFQENDFMSFIVDRSTPGITISDKDTNLEDTCDIVFKDVLVSKDQLLGADNIGVNALSKVLPEYHLNMSVININIIKNLLNSLSNELLLNTLPGDETYQTEAVTSQVSEILSYAYMVESMVYMTSGLMSSYENQDCELESLITRVFSTELALKSTSLGLSLVGTSSLNSEHFSQKLHKKAITQYISYENENIAKLLVGLLGIQHSGKSIGGTVKKLRNPLYHGTFLLKRLWQYRKQQDDNPELTLGLKSYFHPSCQEAADEIEYCVLRLQYATEIFLGNYGIDALNYHNHIRRLSESVMYTYAMISSLSRASRSYCIGLENNETEMLIANIVCRNSFKHVKAILNDVIQECLIMDDPLKKLSENLYSKKCYYLTHPLSHNF